MTAKTPEHLSHPEQRALLIDACRHLAAAGLSPGSSGNISLRVDENTVLVTPTGSALRRVRADELVAVTLDEDAPGGDASARHATKELPLHRAIYRARSDAAAIVHLHSPYATAVACLPPQADGSAQLPPLTPYRVMRLGAVPLVPYAAPGSIELGTNVERLAAENATLLLANHGSVVAERDLDAAIDLTEELETAAQLTMLLGVLPHHELAASALDPSRLDAAAVDALTRRRTP